jgi:hypothetical protein
LICINSTDNDYYNAIKEENWKISSFEKINQDKDLAIFNDTRTWHNTIWQKVVENGEEKYIFITDLNLV